MANKRRGKGRRVQNGPFRFVAWVTDKRTGKRRYAWWYGLKAFRIPVKDD